MEEENKQPDSQTQEQKLAQISTALGVFMLCFSIIIFVAIYYTETFVGKMTNLAAGLLLGLVSGIMIWRGIKGSKKS